MRLKPISTVVLVAAFGSFAWAGPAGLQAQASGSSRSSSQGSGQAGLAGQQGSAAVASGTQISAELLTSLNAKKTKPGQQVVAKVTKDVKQNGQTVIHKGSRLVGHVVSVQPSSSVNAGSQMNVAFDQLVQGNSTTALNAVVNSIVSVPSLAPAAMGDMQPMPGPMMGGGGGAMGGGGARGGGGLVGGAVGGTVGAAGSAVGTVGSTAGAVGSTVGTTAGAAAQSANQVTVGASRAAGGALGASSNTNASASHSAGLGTGLGGIQLGSMAGASNQTNANSVFSARKGNLQLQSGTQLQLQVVGSAQAHSPARQ
ncbi:MAG TPA: hypothetical protein VGS20_07435 [Candidatus Acidoferrales bacterium]|nr:hypothetical protein [Candidatus Acidoferrales bacterium]